MRYLKGIWLFLTFGGLLLIGEMQGYYNEKYPWFLLIIGLMAGSAVAITIRGGKESSSGRPSSSRPSSSA